jgi:hypothetical protein
MSVREQDEYRALRDTIRERGTARVWVFVAGVSVWAALTLAIAALASTPMACLLPLLVLGIVFEAVFALHVGVERVGRYLQVFHESEAEAAGEAGRAGGLDGTLGWEHAAMAFGRPAGAATADPLFVIPFLLAGLFNIAPALLLHPIPEELIVVGGAHLLFVLRLVFARRAAATQRAIDLARFQQIRG